MMNKLWIAIGVVLICISVVSSTIPDYLKVSTSDISPAASARMGQPVAASITLKKVGVVPDEARLNITVELDRPDVKITIDNVTESYGQKAIEIPLTSAGVSEIEVRASGYAPSVEKMKDVKVLDVKTYVLYKGEEGEYQNEGALTLTISTKEITQTVLSIEAAKEKLQLAKEKIDTLKLKGVNTVDLEAEVSDAEDQITLAETLHEDGKIELAKTTADLAKNALERTIVRANEMGAGPAPLDVKKYLTIAAAVIVVLIIALFIMGKREELG